MISTKYIGWLVAFISASTVLPTFAGDVLPFTPERFQAMGREDKPFLVEAYAEWCPICKRQAPIVDRLVHSPAYAAVTVLRIDYDQQKEALKSLRIGMQGTLVVFKGRDERDRSVAATSEREISALLDSVMK